MVMGTRKGSWCFQGGKKDRGRFEGVLCETVLIMLGMAGLEILLIAGFVLC